MAAASCSSRTELQLSCWTGLDLWGKWPHAVASSSSQRRWREDDDVILCHGRFHPVITKSVGGLASLREDTRHLAAAKSKPGTKWCNTRTQWPSWTCEIVFSFVRISLERPGLYEKVRYVNTTSLCRHGHLCLYHIWCNIWAWSN